jgi:hypothetical protein
MTTGGDGRELYVGDTVDVPGGMHGTVKFVGTVRGKKGVFAGVELSKEFAPRGKNDGDVDGYVMLCLFRLPIRFQRSNGSFKAHYSNLAQSQDTLLHNFHPRLWHILAYLPRVEAIIHHIFRRHAPPNSNDTCLSRSKHARYHFYYSENSTKVLTISGIGSTTFEPPAQAQTAPFPSKTRVSLQETAHTRPNTRTSTVSRSGIPLQEPNRHSTIYP